MSACRLSLGLCSAHHHPVTHSFLSQSLHCCSSASAFYRRTASHGSSVPRPLPVQYCSARCTIIFHMCICPRCALCVCRHGAVACSHSPCNLSVTPAPRPTSLYSSCICSSIGMSAHPRVFKALLNHTGHSADDAVCSAVSVFRLFWTTGQVTQLWVGPPVACTAPWGICYSSHMLGNTQV